MSISKKSESIVIGMALFSMFFGAGNLIYPLFVGVKAQNLWFNSSLGFLITAVLLPFLGVLAMVLFKGSYQNFFKILGKNLGFLFSVLLLTVWIPLGSAPRCIALTYSSISSFFNIGPIWLFSFVYSFLVFLVISGKMGFINFLGKVITPLLIGSILVIFFVGMTTNIPLKGNNVDFSFFNGLVEGYNTMDLIASFFFSASIIHILYKRSNSMPSSLKTIIKSSIVGMILLAFVYIILIYTSAKYNSFLQDIKKDQLLVYLAQVILGHRFSVISLVAIILACFSTSIALMIAYSDFLQNEIIKNRKDVKYSIILAILVSYVMSLFGLQGISFITTPILKVCYPALLSLILINIVKIVVIEKLAYKTRKPKEIEKFESID